MEAVHLIANISLGRVGSHTVDSALSGLCVQWTNLLVPARCLFILMQTLCVKRTSVLCGQWRLLLKILSDNFVFRGQIGKIHVFSMFLLKVFLQLISRF